MPSRSRPLLWLPLAAALACGLGTRAIAQPHAHDHEPASAPHTLSLDHGRRWATDDALRQGMGRLRGLVAPKILAVHRGRLEAAQYRALAQQVDTEVSTIVSRCKLPPQADAMLHLVIADLLSGARAMAGQDAAVSPTQGLARTAQALNAYGRHFDHPGFKPIRLDH